MVKKGQLLVSRADSPEQGERLDPRPAPEEMAVDKVRAGDLHPDVHRLDHRRMEKDSRTAFDIKDVHRRLQNLPDDVLKQIPVLPEGTLLTPGKSYLDLAAIERGELIPADSQRVGRDNWIVPKNEVDYQTWNVLLGVDNPERTGMGSER